MIQDKPWAIHPAKLDEIQTFIDSRLTDKTPDFFIEGRAPGKSGLRAGDVYEIQDGVAVIPVYGVLEKRANLVSDFSGGTSTQLLKRNLEAALRDDQVQTILLDVDSPGGSVDGTKAVADFILENRWKKPMLAFANGMAASAAYWIASAAGEVMAEDTALVGSIGVALTHFDRSGRDAQQGIRRTQIFSGRYKRIASDEKPLTEEGQAYLQGIVDSYYEIFVEAIARNRAVSFQRALSMADGKEFIGRQALEAGLVDSIGNFDQALARAKEMGHPRKARPAGLQRREQLMKTDFMSEVDRYQKEKKCSRTEALSAVAAENPELHWQFVDQGPRGSRLTGSVRQAEAFRQVPIMNRVIEDSDFMGEVDRYQIENRCTRTEALLFVADKHPTMHQAWLDRTNGGRRLPIPESPGQ
jgi:signal peptide peptidase SppA